MGGRAGVLRRSTHRVSLDPAQLARFSNACIDGLRHLRLGGQDLLQLLPVGDRLLVIRAVKCGRAGEKKNALVDPKKVSGAIPRLSDQLVCRLPFSAAELVMVP